MKWIVEALIVKTALVPSMNSRSGQMTKGPEAILKIVPPFVTDEEPEIVKRQLLFTYMQESGGEHSVNQLDVILRQWNQ